MCESNAFILKEGKEELLLADVEEIKIDGEKLYLRSILGEQKQVEGRIKEMNLVDHRIVIEKT